MVSNDDVRRELFNDINATAAQTRKEAEERFGRVWDTKELQEEFHVQGFLAPFVIVERLSDGKTGSLMFQHAPRFYYKFEEDKR
jgi:hypothetical protein